MQFTKVSTTALSQIIATALAALLVGSSMFILFEPAISHSQSVGDEFTVRQEITDEIAFVLAAADVVMSQSIPGITGGQATGTTQVRVRTNSASGYTLEMRFSDDPAMQGETTAGEINNYTPASPGVPDFLNTPNATGGAAEFAYTVSASTTADLDQSFQDNGAACNNLGSQTANRCWLNPSTTDEVIIDRSTATPASGGTTTITFQVDVPANPNPVLPGDFYRATATLTATVQ